MQDDLVKELESHGDYLADIELDTGKMPLDCGLKAFTENKYIWANRGNMVVFAARAGNGKTSLACQIAMHVSKSTKVLYFSLEMDKSELLERLISVHSGIEIDQLNNPNLRKKVEAAKVELKQYNFKIIDTPRMSFNRLLSIIIDESRNEGLGLVVIDYIGLLSGDKTDQRHQDIGEIASKIKTEIANKFNIPVLVLAQMNTDIDRRFAFAKMKGKEKDVRPVLADIGESKKIADAADTVLFFYRPCLNDPFVPREIFQVFVLKNRKGTTKDCTLNFSEKLTKFYGRDEYDFV